MHKLDSLREDEKVTEFCFEFKTGNEHHYSAVFTIYRE